MPLYPKPMNVLSCAVLTLLVLSPAYVLSHEDWVFVFQEGGSIDGLPVGYGPTWLRISDAEIVFQTGESEYVLPECLIELFTLPTGEAISVQGSAHHDLSRLPPYLVVQLPRHTYVEGWFDGYSLTFHLKTAELLDVQRSVVTPSSDPNLVGMSQRNEPVHSEFCGGENLEFKMKPRACSWFRRITRRCS